MKHAKKMMALLLALAMLMALATPFVLGFLLRKFRNGVLDGVISFGRGWGYSVLTCFYASLLFGLSVYAYFTFLDQGYLFDALAQMLQRADMAPVLKQGNLGTLLTDSLQQMKTMRPIDLALNMMFSCLMIGMLLALPIAALLQKAVRTT